MSGVDRGVGQSRKAFLLATMALVLAVGALTVAAVVWVDGRYQTLFDRSEEQLAEALTEDVGLLAAQALNDRDLDGLVVTQRGLLERTSIRDVVVLDSDSRVVAHLSRSGVGDNVIEKLEAVTLEPPAEARMERTPLGILVHWAPLPGVAELGWVRVEVASIRATGGLEVLRRETLVAALFGGVLLLVLTLLSMTGAYRVVQRRESGLVIERDDLHEAAHHDRLTGVFNRAGLLERLGRPRASQRADATLLAVCFLDLDGFKAVNDRYGHEIGDLLLVEVARRLSASVRESDMVVRLGGDEFVLLLEGENWPGELSALLDGVVSRVSQRVPAAGQPLRIGVSMGVAVRLSAADTADGLIQRADEAMYEAKRAGGNRWVLHHSVGGQLFSPA